jgi:hypothetical protein
MHKFKRSTFPPKQKTNTRVVFIEIAMNKRPEGFLTAFKAGDVS